MSFLINHQIANGIDFLVPCGTTGESSTLSHEEHLDVIAYTVIVNDGRVPILAGTGSNSTGESVHLTKMAKKLGADGVLVVSPYYTKPMEAGFLDYYRKIAAVGLPVILYDIPGRTAKRVPTAVIVKLAKEGSIAGIKWASGDELQLKEIVKKVPADFSVLSGDDKNTLTLMKAGGDGVISVVSHIIPREMSLFVKAMQEKKWKMAEQFQQQYLPLMEGMFIETNPMPVKTAMSLLYPEYFSPIFGSPMAPMEKHNVEKLKKVLTDNPPYFCLI
jgi:4-hydroxy-tetrahydrodipicolinate synthase